ncbi:MAG: Na+/H+ antiporter subunit B [Candidatus Hydrogenedentes bacterium]|nr:Na+/H+ antiporter subunit B [Candidatus Hydrogenedentota bacterium]
MLLLSVLLLLRGHNEPGGGFVGGLLAATAFTLHALAQDVNAARRAVHVSPQLLIAAGLGIALLSGFPGVLQGDPFLTGLWGSFHLPAVGELTLGTPLLFDVGVYLVVVGVVLTITFAILESYHAD